VAPGLLCQCCYPLTAVTVSEALEGWSATGNPEGKALPRGPPRRILALMPGPCMAPHAAAQAAMVANFAKISLPCIVSLGPEALVGGCKEL
jgi:hypothetical protein